MTQVMVYRVRGKRIRDRRLSRLIRQHERLRVDSAKAARDVALARRRVQHTYSGPGRGR